MVSARTLTALELVLVVLDTKATELSAKISMNVKRTTGIVILMPCVSTLLAIDFVNVRLDTQGMESNAKTLMNVLMDKMVVALELLSVQILLGHELVLANLDSPVTASFVSLLIYALFRTLVSKTLRAPHKKEQLCVLAKLDMKAMVLSHALMLMNACPTTVVVTRSAQTTKVTDFVVVTKVMNSLPMDLLAMIRMNVW